MSNMGTGQEQAANAHAQLAAAVRAYEEARSDGLCLDGAWECALAALGGTGDFILFLDTLS